MGKSKRAKAAARAAKQIPIVGAAVALEPAVEAAATEFGSDFGNVFKLANWMAFLRRLSYNYTGSTGSGVDGARIARTWAPILVYVGAKKTGLSKPISRVLGRFGLRF